MKLKQVISIFIVCLILVVTGLIGVRVSIYMNRIKEESASKAIDNLEEMVDTSNDDITLPQEDFIGQIDVVGTIQGDSSAADSVSGNQTYSHDFYLKYIEAMEKAVNNKGIFLYVDSPGGTVYESDELYLRLLEYKEKTGRPIYAYFGNQACSGAYYVSMAADEIYANRNTWTGSIGVILSMMNYEGLLKKIGVQEIDIVSGKNKTIGSGAHEMTPEQAKILQDLVDESYEQFTQIVATGRDMKIEKVKKLADGRIYSASQAKKYGLVDEVMGIEDAKANISTALGNENITYFVPKKKNTIQYYFGQIFGLADIFGKQSDIQAARDMIENDESGVLMYYAK